MYYIISFFLIAMTIHFAILIKTMKNLKEEN